MRKLEKWCSNGILERENCTVLKKLIKKCDNYDEAISILEIATQSRKTGLYYRHQFEKIDTDFIYYLKKDTKRSIKNNSKINKLIIGDNYLALKNLLISDTGSIDVIYIDPPYGCNDMGEFADVNYENKITRDNLLSQLFPRLILARQLLSEDGVIFLSIDDKNQAYIKCLMDDIFDERNYIGNFYWIRNPSGKSNSKFLSKTYDYILMYVKNRDCFEINKPSKEIEICGYKWNEKLSRYEKKKNVLEKGGEDSNLIDRPYLGYVVWYNPKTNEVYTDASSYDPTKVRSVNISNEIYDKSSNKWQNNIQKGFIPIMPKKRNGMYGRWRMGIEKFERLLKEKRWLFEKDKNGDWRIYELDITETIEPRNHEFLPKDTIDWISNSVATRELKTILPTTKFIYPKPVDLIKYLIKLHPNKSAKVLDFYGGSGTTAHATMELNRNDKGNRTFIVCSNVDKGNGNFPNGIAIDVLYERLLRIITGKSSGNEKFDWINENKPFNVSLDVNFIEKIRNNDKRIFNVIDPQNYGFSPKTIQKKIEWICQNFETMQDVIRETSLEIPKR